ncbi:L-seryl-tRNA(Sec) kinase-like [Tropilaelaps mercedesae]|uniref:L-seryl-tRNA(Sec) kinase-like n=1 Tax=Tropilaelaps mercedesae TaxID=418985 RepID=A0A1V9XXF4_9ACAR|nr:L-seryl-tRNA(Sec) kinase-like [Tropilaelaps mercedesae]
MATDAVTIVVVLICGPPASGKTTLALKLKQKLDHCLLLSFDDIFSATEQEAAVKTKGHLKLLRRTMLEGVKNIIDGRTDTMEAKRIFDSIQLNAQGSKTWQYIIIDDNLYLRSMRYCWFQAARTRSISLCNIYLATSLKRCLHHNRQRASPVLEKVIVEQFKKMEPPASRAHIAEKFTLTVNVPDDSEFAPVIKRAIEIISAAQLSPFSPQSTDNNTQEKKEKAEFSRSLTRASKSHNIDLAFRRAISSLTKNGTMAT